MSDLERRSPIELEIQIEPKDVTGFRRVAEKLGDYTRDLVDGAKNAGQKFLEKTWYSHKVSLFYLEGTILKQIGFAIPEASLAGKILTQLGAIVTSENVTKTVKAGEIEVGEHMTVSVEAFGDLSPKELPDGSILRPGQRIGRIDFERNMPKLRKDVNLIAFTRQLFRSGKQSLVELAELCQRNDPRLGGVEYFWGTSHLAGPLAKRLGFDVFDIANPIERLGYRVLEKGIAFRIGGKNKQWQMFAQNFKSPREAVIPRHKLVELFGNKNE